MDIQKPYQPIDCNYHDKLLHHATRRDKVTFELLVGGEMQTVEAVIKDVYTSKSEEFMDLSNGMRVRLDHIARMNGELLEGGFCGVDEGMGRNPG